MKLLGDIYLKDKENNTNSPESTIDPNYKKQLPWLTLYKTHKDLLQIKLVTTVAYVETTHDPNDPNDTHYEAAYIKGFPLMLQGSNNQFDNKSNITEDDWENNWPFYYQHVEDFSHDLSNNVPNWNNYTGNSKVII